MHAAKLILTSCFLSLILIANSSSLAQEPQNQYKAMPPKEGERCIICNVSLSKDDVILMVRGRRVPLKNVMVDSFMNNQEKYFAELQPKAALFQENMASTGTAQGGISSGWFLFGSYILIALFFSGLSGYAAISKGLPPIQHYFVGFFFSVLGYIYVLSRPALTSRGDIPAGFVKVPTTHAPVPCKKCGNTNHPSAEKCSGCGAQLEPQMQSEVERS